MTADRIAAALTALRRHLNAGIPGSRLLARDGMAAWITGIPQAAFNRVWLEDPNPPVTAFSAVLNEMTGAGVPFALDLRPSSDAVLGYLAAARGMVPRGQLALMTLEARAGARGMRRARGLAVRQLAPGEEAEYAKAVITLGGPGDALLPGSGLMRLDGVRCYLGEADGQPVTAALSVTTGDLTALVHVATHEAYQGRGFGSAVAARAVADGALAGAPWCWAQSPAEGYALFRGLGFRTAEMRPSWVSH